jgi:hypothetical protein
MENPEPISTIGLLIMVFFLVFAMTPELIALILLSPLIAWEMWLDYLKARDAARAGAAKGRDDELA